MGLWSATDQGHIPGDSAVRAAVPFRALRVYVYTLCARHVDADTDFQMQRRGLCPLSALLDRRAMRLLHNRRGLREFFAVDWPPCPGHVSSVQALATDGMEASLAST